MDRRSLGDEALPELLARATRQTAGPLTTETTISSTQSAHGKAPRRLPREHRARRVTIRALPKRLRAATLACRIDVLSRAPSCELCSCAPCATPRIRTLQPHPYAAAAFYSEEGIMDMRTKGSENCRRALLGEPLRNVINAAP